MQTQLSNFINAANIIDVFNNTSKLDLDNVIKSVSSNDVH